MAKASVTLQGSATWEGRGYRFEKSKRVIVTNDADILYFQQQGGFAVTMLEGTKPRPAPKPAPPAVEASGSPPAPPADPEDEGRASEGAYTRADLEAMTKSALMELVDDDDALDVKLDQSMKKPEMVDAILDAQST